MKENVTRLFGRMAASVLVIAAFAFIFAVPVVGAAERDRFRTGNDLQWYDPRGWFERGGSVEHEADWFDYTFAYGRRTYNGSYGPYGEPMPFGYFGERPAGEPALLYDQDMERNYYTRDWYNREGFLENWLR